MRGAQAAIVAAQLAAACHGAVLQPEPQFPPCRELVAADKRGPVPPVRWFGPGQDDEVISHFKWCRAIGPMVLFRPDRGPAPPLDSLAIVSFNVNLGAASAAELVDSLRAGAFTGGVPVIDFVLLLQESIREGPLVPDRVPSGSGTGAGRYPAPARGPRLDIVRIADSLGLHLFYAPAMRSGKGKNPGGLSEDRGNAILSSVPLDGLGLVELPFAGQRRIAILAHLSGRTSLGRPWSIQVANVHFTVGPIGPSALSAGRARQARAMVGAVDSSGGVILGGDLNAFTILGTAESVQILSRAFPQTPPGDDAPTHGSQRLDYLFFRLPTGYRALPYHRLPTTFGADHYPIFGWVRFGA